MGTGKVYVCDDVRAVQRLHVDLLGSGFNSKTIREQLDGQAINIVAGHARGDSAIKMHLKSWLPNALNKPIDVILSEPLSLLDARFSMAREYGFAAWSDVDALDDLRPEFQFETAVDALVSGEMASLARLLSGNPDLVRARSRYGHRAMLLHYVAANGVETYRQQIPMNIVDIAALLLRAGADVNATASMYGGRPTTHDLVMSSAHPKAVGVQEDLGRLLRKANGR